MVGSVAGCAALLTDTTQYFVPFLSAMLFSYSGGAYLDGRRAYVALAIMCGGILTVTMLSPSQIAGDYIFPTAFGAISWLAGRAVRTRTRLTEELHEAALREQEAHELEARRAAADERRRIAREMHDVVAHSVSVMVVQAGGARRILERDPDRAVAAAAQIERTGREALAEMRRLLGVLHRDDDAHDAARAAADDGRRRRARRARARGRAAGRAARRGRAALAAGRAGPGGVPRRPGGPDERAQVRRARAHRRARALGRAHARARDPRPRARPGARPARAATAATASSACASA